MLLIAYYMLSNSKQEPSESLGGFSNSEMDQCCCVILVAPLLPLTDFLILNCSSQICDHKIMEILLPMMSLDLYSVVSPTLSVRIYTVL